MHTCSGEISAFPFLPQTCLRVSSQVRVCRTTWAQSTRNCRFHVSTDEAMEGARKNDVSISLTSRYMPFVEQTAYDALELT
jgi:hypothetical protein